MDMEDMEGYREARAQAYERRAGNFELEGFINGMLEGSINDAQKQKFAGRCGSACCILMSVLMSIGSLMPLQYGMTINAITRQVNSDGVYQGGRHLIGPWNSFIPFPSTIVTVSFIDSGANQALATRTKDGLELKLQLAFQYQLDPENLGKLYQMANMQYEDLFVRNARDVLLKAAGEYEATDWWQDREKIGVEMMVLLNERLASVYTSCTGLQLLVVELPEAYETSIVNTQVQQQQVRTRQNEQQVSRINADTLVLQASFRRNVTVTRSRADSLYNQLTSVAEAQANQRMLEIEAHTMRNIQEQLGLNPKQMVAYQQYAAFRSMQNASFIYGLGNVMLTLPGGR